MRTQSAFLFASSCLALVAARSHAGDRLFVYKGGMDRYDLPGTVFIRFSTNGGVFAACSPDGFLFGSNFGNDTIERRDQDGGSAAVIKLPPGTEPAGVAVDLAGDLWINTAAPFPGTGIWRVRGADAGNPPERVFPPWGFKGSDAEVVTGGPHSGALLIAQQRPPKVFLSEPPGAPLVTFIEPRGFGPTNTDLWALATDDCGRIFVGMSGLTGEGWRVDHFDPEGGFLGTYSKHTPASPFCAASMDFDSDGNLFTYSALGDIVYRIAPDRGRTIFRDELLDGNCLTICRKPLTADAGGPYHAECAGSRTCVGLNAPPLSACAECLWTSDCPGGDFGGTESSATPTLCLDSTACPTTCRATVTLKQGIRTAAAAAEVVIQDTTPPVVTPASSDLACLWPPDHRHVCFGRKDFAPGITEACSDTVTWRFDGCASDQPDDADESDPASPWDGDGHTTGDCLVKPGGEELCVRAERCGSGPAAKEGRRYAVSIVAADGCGNESPATVIGRIHVPHSRSPASPCGKAGRSRRSPAPDPADD